MRQGNTDGPQGRSGNARRYAGPVIAAGFLIVSIAAALVTLFAVMLQDPADGPPIWFLVLYLLLSAVVLAGTVAVLRQRIRELQKGEEDEARKY